jgi:hypothetical protein
MVTEFIVQCTKDVKPMMLGKVIISEKAAKAKLKEGNWERVDMRVGPHKKLRSYMVKEIK